MDKNTIYGLILIGLVFFAFMYFSPHDEQAAETETKAKTEQPAPVMEKPEPLTDTETGWLRTNLRDNGTATSAEGATVYRLQYGALDLALKGDSISGTVMVDGKPYSYAQINGNDASMNSQQRVAALKILRNVSEQLGRYGRFTAFLSGKDSVVKLQNNVLSLELSAKSGSITRAELLKYYTEYNSDETKKDKRKVVLFHDTTNSMSFDIPTAQSVNTHNLYFTPRVVNDSTVLMTLDFGGGAYWGIRYILPKGDRYDLKMQIVQHGVDKIIASNNTELGFHWHQNLARQEKGRMFEEQKSGLYYKFAGGSVENLSEGKDDSEERQAKIRWIAFKNQFFTSAVFSRRPFNTADFSSVILKKQDYLKSFTTDAKVNDYDWRAAVPAEFDLFLGPNLYPLLSDMDKTLDMGENLSLTRLIPLGWSLFRWINTLIVIPVFTFLGSFGMNYGIVILLLTLFIKLVLYPLTYKSLISQAKMRILAPDIKAINDKYPGKDNAMLRQQKTMALYSKAGASPMSGCVPMLLQLPILFAMFSFFPSCIELRGQSFLWAQDLSAPDAIISWSGNIPLITEYFGNHISLFCLLMTATNIIYTYTNSQNQAGAMPGMKWMMYLMPVFFMVFFNNYAAALSYYYFLSLLITISLTFIFRKVVKEEDVRKKMAEAAKKPKKKSGFMARLEEMQRQQQEMLKQQQKAKGSGNNRTNRRR